MRAPIAITLAVVGAGSASGQGAILDSASCAAVLNAPTADSALVEYHAFFSPSDTTRRLPNSYSELLGQGLRQELVLPRPVPVSTYGDAGDRALPEPSTRAYAVSTLQSVYRLTLHRDGTLTSPHAVGGVRDPAFDGAILRAVAKLDSDQLVPLSRDSVEFDHDTLELRLTIAPAFIVPARAAVQWPRSPGFTPLFRVRLPVYPIQKRVTPGSEDRPPRYPTSMRDRHIDGEVNTEFIVRADGMVQPGSMKILRASSVEFAQSVTEYLKSARFEPMQIAGCSVASLVQMPFMFSTSR